eukprot:7390077-Prymnesium_polylepis.1
MSVWASFKRSAAKAIDDDAHNASRPRTSFGADVFGAGEESVDKRAGFNVNFNSSPFVRVKVEQEQQKPLFASTTSSLCAPLFSSMQIEKPVQMEKP